MDVEKLFGVYGGVILEHSISNKKDDEGKCLDYIKIHNSNLHIPFTSGSDFVF